MGKWKPWQYVFLAYLLLLNFVVFCVLSFFVLNHGLLSFESSSQNVALASPIPTPKPASPTPTVTPSRTPTLPPVEPTAMPVIIPPVNIPPVPLPAQPQNQPAIQPTANSQVDSSPVPPLATETPVPAQNTPPPAEERDSGPPAPPESHPAPTEPAIALAQAATLTPTPSATPSPSNTPSPTPSQTHTPTATPTFTASPTVTPSFTPTPSATATFTPFPTATPTFTPTPTVTPSFTPAPTATATRTPSATSSLTPSPTASRTPRPTATQTKTAIPSPTLTPTASRTATSTPTASATATATGTPRPTFTTSPTPTGTFTPTPTRTPLPAATPTKEVRIAMAAGAPHAPLTIVDPAITEFSATPLTNGSVALSWTPVNNVSEYQVYSDMGSGFGVYVHKAVTRQPAFIDRQLRVGTTYSYRLTRQEQSQPVILAQINASTFAKTPGSKEPVPTSQLEVAPASVVAAPTALPPDAVLLGLVSDNNYTDDFNTLTIVGEVRNDSNLDVGQTDIAVMFYDVAGAIIGTASGTTMLDVIPPGEKSPFIITLTRPAGLASHSLRAVGRPVVPEQGSQLTVTDVKRFEDDAGFFHVKGTIENVGSTTARRVKVGVVIYNRDNRVINVGFTYTNPPKLVPGQTASYEVIFDYFPRYFAQQVIPFEE